MLRNPPPRRRGRPPGIGASRLIKRIVIAAGVLQGVKIAQVARDLGVSRSWASREAHDPERQGFIRGLKKEDPETGAASLSCALKTIADHILDAEAAWSEFVRARRLLQTYYRGAAVPAPASGNAPDPAQHPRRGRLPEPASTHRFC